MSDDAICEECGERYPASADHGCQRTIEKWRDLALGLESELAAERARTDALVASLPKCDECPRPATKAVRRGEGRWCDEHGDPARMNGRRPFWPTLQEPRDYPRAEPLRAIAKARRRAAA